jgi:hypothetical protein
MSEHEDFLANKTFAAAFVAAYRGRHSPADALWWLAHPLEPAPSGAPSPAAGHEALKAAAFSRTGDYAAEDVLAHLEAQLRSDTADTRSAVVHARRAAEKLSAYNETSPADPSEDLVHRAWKAPLIAALAIAAFGVLAGIQFGSASGRGVATPPAAASPSYTQLAIAEPKMLDIFDIPQDEADRLGFDSPTLDEDSSKLIASNGDGQNGADVFAAYAARDSTGTNTCLILLVLSDESWRHSWTCVNDRQVPASGLSISYDDDTTGYQFTWQPDGTYEVTHGSSDNP